MRTRFLAMLILTSWAQLRGAQRMLPEPPRGGPLVGVNLTRGGQPQMFLISIEMPAPPDEDDDDHRPPRPIMRLDLKTAVLERENFDRFLFADERSEGERRRHLEELLAVKVEAAAARLDLTDRQRAKLRLAGRGDIKRFFDRVGDRKGAFERSRRGFKTGMAALRGLEPLAQLYQEGPFGDGSLFAKTLRKIVDDREAAR